MTRIKVSKSPRKQQLLELDHIEVKGAEEHNLKKVNASIPKKKLVVFTGVSGSGKSSLAFDTIFAEGQRRYVESLSSYARQFLGQMEKPKYETIRGLAPTISIEQKAASKNPRSTVGTITEVYDYLRVLYARIGEQTCHICSKVVGRGDAESMVNQVLSQIKEGQQILLLAPKLENRKGTHRELIDEAKQKGYSRLRVNGLVSRVDDVQNLAKHKKHTIEVVVDRLKAQNGDDFRQRLTDSIETTLKEGDGRMIVHFTDEQGKKSRDLPMSEHRSCCGFAFPQLDPPLFSFNSPQGMCISCNGLGSVLQIDEEKLIPDPDLSIREGAVVPWRNYFTGDEGEKESSWSHERFLAMQQNWGINFDTPWRKIPLKKRKLILYGSQKENELLTLQVNDEDGEEDTWVYEYEGLVNTFMRRYLKTKSESMKTWYQKFMANKPCPDCHGQRLKPEVLAVHVRGQSINDLCRLSINDTLDFFDSLKLSSQEQLIASELLKEIRSRLSFLLNVGLGYLTLNRHGPSLSGGEAQRIRLASQIGSELTGVLYILDEPSIGLHQRDNQKLLATLQRLRDLGNSVIVVEHDQETIEAADWVVDFGPGAGVEGGNIVASGTPAQIRRAKDSLTGQYLSGKKQIRCPNERRQSKDKSQWLEILGASENNLKNVDIRIPQGLLTVVSGVSGAGKSTLINQILYPAMARHLHQSQLEVGAYRKINGLNGFDKVINIDQKPIGRTPRSNPATYTKVFDHIRDFFALLPESKIRGYEKGRFSFNVKGGRCEPCQGDGYIKVEMHFLADVFVPCEICKGRRFNQATCEVKYHGHSIADVLDLSVAEARKLFERHPRIKSILDTLIDVGLSYIKIGQAATTLSGGEAQRIKLARELAKRDTGRTLYILDEPTTGLHFHDIDHLLQVLHRLVDAGNTVVVIEHNLDVIKSADWVIDMGPEGGDGGGEVIGFGTPEKIAGIKKSATGQYLKPLLR
ncbi:MAG: excinuclease ABC subunit UvrA [Oligoflexus sp.]